MHNLSTITHTVGSVTGTLTTWRNSNGTAFASLSINNCTPVEAKSQGPSAGGYCKPTQALERMARKLGMESMPWDLPQRPERFLAYVIEHYASKVQA